MPPAIIPSLPPAGSLFLHEPSCLYEGKAAFSPLFSLPRRGLLLFPGLHETVSLPKAWENTGQAIVRGSFMRRTRNAISPKLYNARVAVSSRSQNGGPSPFPDFHPGRSGFAVSFIFFHLIGICRGFCPSSAYFTSPPGPALHSPVAKISFLLSFQPSPWCAPLSPFLSVLPGLALPRRESFFAFFQPPPGVLHCLLSSPFCPALYSPVAKVSLLFSFQPPPVCSIVSFPLRTARPCTSLVTKVSLLLSFQRKKGPSLRGTPFPRFFFLIS